MSPMTAKYTMVTHDESNWPATACDCGRMMKPRRNYLYQGLSYSTTICDVCIKGVSVVYETYHEIPLRRGVYIFYDFVALHRFIKEWSWMKFEVPALVKI